MSTQTPTGCPSWCDRDHETHVHRGNVGETAAGGRAVAVVILQVPGNAPSVAISGAGIGVVGLATDDLGDAATLMDVLERPELAALIRKAGAILAGS